MADAVDDADGGDSAADDGQNADGEVVEGGVLFFVDDVDRLDLCEEVDLLEGLVAWRLPRSQRIPILFSSLNKRAIFIKHNRNNFQVIEKVNLIVLLRKVLNELPRRNISLQILNVVLDHFGLVGDGEVEEVVAQAELQSLELV